MVFIGIGVDVIPLFLKEGMNGEWFWVLVLFSGYIPAATANVYKEHWLKDKVCACVCNAL